MNNTAISLLLEAQQELNRIDAERAEDNESTLHCNDFRNRLLFSDLGNGLAIEYFGEVWQDGDGSAWSVVQQTLSNSTIAKRLTSLRITGPDEGANGSRTHDFDELLESKTSFPELLELYIRPTGVSDHNFVGIEDGQNASLIALCPNLEALTLPQSPEPDFFKIQLKQLRYARFGMAWQTFGFIRNMALHHNMPDLRVLDFTDSLSVFQPPRAQSSAKVSEKNASKPIDLGAKGMEKAFDLFKQIGYGEKEFEEMRAAAEQANAELKDLPPSTYDDNATPFEDYCSLLASPAIHKGMVVHLRNVRLNEEQFKHLNQLKDIQLSVSLEAPHVYVSHWEKKFKTPYQHLIFSNK